MNCRDFIDFLLDYFAGDLSPATLAVFHEHMAKCPPCVAYLRCYEQTLTLCQGAYPDEPHSAELPEELIQAILDARHAPKTS